VREEERFMDWRRHGCGALVSLVYGLLLLFIPDIAACQQIERSGISRDNLGTTFLITQGLSGASLVAGKQTLLRLFVDAIALPNVTSLAVSAAGASPTFDYRFSSPLLIVETQSPNGPSVGAIIPGFAFPESGDYRISITASNSQGSVVRTTTTNARFLP